MSYIAIPDDDRNVERLPVRAADGLGRITAIPLRRLRTDALAVAEHLGAVAQELDGVLSEAVEPGGDDPSVDPWRVRWAAVIPHLVRAVQQLSNRHDALVATLQARIGELQARLDALEGQ